MLGPTIYACCWPTMLRPFVWALTRPGGSWSRVIKNILATNKHVNEVVTSKVWLLSTK